MGDVFDREMDKYQVNKISTKLEILAEQAPVLYQGKKSDQLEVYMIVAMPIKDEDFEEETWQGTIQ